MFLCILNIRGVMEIHTTKSKINLKYISDDNFYLKNYFCEINYI